MEICKTVKNDNGTYSIEIRFYSFGYMSKDAGGNNFRYDVLVDFTRKGARKSGRLLNSEIKSNDVLTAINEAKEELWNMLNPKNQIAL